MLKQKKIIIFISLFISIFFVIPMLVTVFTHNYHFNKRVTHENSYFEYLTKKNPDFQKDEVYFNSNNGQILNGAFYSQEKNDSPKALIVFSHGMKVNHENYIAEIEYLTKENYLVFAYNNTGVDTSEGASLKGLLQSPIDLQYALTYIYGLDMYNDIPNILIGHSWGGFAVSTVSQLDIPRKVDGIISLAGFWKNTNVIEDIAKYYVGDIISLLSPYLSLYEYLLFPEHSYLNGVDGLKKAGDIPIMLIHSQDDITVSFNSNFMHYKERFSNNSNIIFKEYTDAGHKLTVSKESYDRIHDIMHHQMDLDKNDEKYKTFEEERISLITDFNKDVMNDILRFCDNICENEN